MTYEYSVIKEMAKERKMSVKSLLALAPINDPFYVGSEGQIQKAKWFAKVYELMGKPTECHIRRVHYWIVSQSPRYKKPDGREYMNTDNDWRFLTMSAKYARYAGLIPIRNIIDRRNPAPIVNASFWEDETPTEIKEEIDAEEIIRTLVEKFYCFNPHNTQPYLMELWCEKSTMNDVLEPLAMKYGLNLVTGLGELSITAVHLLVKRVLESRKPVRIFYISDFDPAGECMPISVARKIEFFLRSEEDEETDVKLKPIMLTPEQCKEFKLPRTPIKATEGRKEGFEARHGTGATELDALEALHPGTMKGIVEEEIMEYFDPKVWNEVMEKNNALKAKVKKYLKTKIGNVLEKLSLKEFDKFQPGRGHYIDDEEEEWLYDSKLNYTDQIRKYKEHKS